MCKQAVNRCMQAWKPLFSPISDPFFETPCIMCRLVSWFLPVIVQLVMTVCVCRKSAGLENIHAAISQTHKLLCLESKLYNLLPLIILILPSGTLQNLQTDTRNGWWWHCISTHTDITDYSITFIAQTKTGRRKNIMHIRRGRNSPVTLT